MPFAVAALLQLWPQKELPASSSHGSCAHTSRAHGSGTASAVVEGKDFLWLCKVDITERGRCGGIIPAKFGNGAWDPTFCLDSSFHGSFRGSQALLHAVLEQKTHTKPNPEDISLQLSIISYYKGDFEHKQQQKHQMNSFPPSPDVLCQSRCVSSFCFFGLVLEQN